MTWNPLRLPDLTGRTYAITGATGGIGYFAAEQLAAAGAEVVLASRSAEKLRQASNTINERVPEAVTHPVQIDLMSLTSVAEAAVQLTGFPRLDGIFLNGGPMQFSGKARTEDGLPLMLGTHVVANFALLSRLLPFLNERGNESGYARIVHASTGFVKQFPMRLDDPGHTPRTGIAAYVKAKTATEIFAHELDRRIRAADLRVSSVLTHPGVGVDAKTPQRTGIRDQTVRYQRNPYTPWAQGKDAATWSGVRALADPQVQGGEYYGPARGLRGKPIQIETNPATANPPSDVASTVWSYLAEAGGAGSIL